jgi:hypothetical protein
MLATMNILAMVSLVVIGSVFLVSSRFDDHSINWINFSLATVCFTGVYLLRPRRSS